MLKIVFINIVLFTALAEATSALLLKDRVQELNQNYLSGNKSKISHYPKDVFEKNTKRGFDIPKNSPKVQVNLPKEAGYYYTWGNSIGCYDDDILSQEKYSIYLAGDSFTWGFAPYEKKFGTRLKIYKA